MAEVVLGKLDLLAVAFDLALVQTVGIATDSCTEVRGVVLWEVGVGTLEAEDHVLQLAILVGNIDGCDTSTEVGDVDNHAIGVLERVEAYLLFAFHSVGVGGVELCGVEACLVCSPFRFVSWVGASAQECHGNTCAKHHRFEIFHHKNSLFFG